MVATGRRTQRKDAVRNYDVVVRAARAVLDELGPDAPMEQIAARAGVGVGTIYRCFPNKDALIDELLRQVIADLDASAEAALTDDDGHGLEHYLLALGEVFAEHRRSAGLMLTRGVDEEGARRVRAHLAQLTKNAVRAGVLEPDVTLGDVMALVWSLRALVEITGDVAPHAWRRHLDVHLAGLRGRRTSPWSKPMTDRQIAQLAPR